MADGQAVFAALNAVKLPELICHYIRLWHCQVAGNTNCGPQIRELSSLLQSRRLKMRTTVLAYLIAAVGLLILIFGVWGFFVLNNAEFGTPLTAYAIVFGLMGGGFAMIGVAQALRLLVALVRNTDLALMKIR
jgi:hypothetical protein